MAGETSIEKAFNDGRIFKELVQRIESLFYDLEKAEDKVSFTKSAKAPALEILGRLFAFEDKYPHVAHDCKFYIRKISACISESEYFAYKREQEAWINNFENYGADNNDRTEVGPPVHS